MKKAILFLNGEPPTDLPDLNTFDTIYCTDGAYAYLSDRDILPDYVVGDFDSFDVNKFSSKVEVIHRPDQDFTDFDKTLQIVENHGFKMLEIYGSTGQEHDHFLGNLSTALAYKNRLELIFHDDYATFYFTSKSFVLTHVKDRTVSLVPFPTAKEVSSSGLRYPLDKLNLEFGKQIGTRNHAVEDTVEVNYTEGELLVFISKKTSK